MSDTFHEDCDRLESELDSLLSPAELKRIRDSETRRAEPHEDSVDMPNLRAPRLPTFFAEHELPTDVDNAIPECEDCGHVHNFDDGCPEAERDGGDYTHISGWGFFPNV